MSMLGGRKVACPRYAYCRAYGRPHPPRPSLCVSSLALKSALPKGRPQSCPPSDSMSTFRLPCTITLKQLLQITLVHTGQLEPHLVQQLELVPKHKSRVPCLPQRLGPVDDPRNEGTRLHNTPPVVQRPARAPTCHLAHTGLTEGLLRRLSRLGDVRNCIPGFRSSLGYQKHGRKAREEKTTQSLPCTLRSPRSRMANRALFLSCTWCAWRMASTTRHW